MRQFEGALITIHSRAMESFGTFDSFGILPNVYAMVWIRLRRFHMCRSLGRMCEN